MLRSTSTRSMAPCGWIAECLHRAACRQRMRSHGSGPMRFSCCRVRIRTPTSILTGRRSPGGRRCRRRRNCLLGCGFHTHQIGAAARAECGRSARAIRISDRGAWAGQPVSDQQGAEHLPVRRSDGAHPGHPRVYFRRRCHAISVERNRDEQPAWVLSVHEQLRPVRRSRMLRLGHAFSYEVTLGELSRGYRNWQRRPILRRPLARERQGAVELWRAVGLRFSGRWKCRTATSSRYDCDCNNFNPRIGLAWTLGRGWLMRSAVAVSSAPIQPVTYQQIRNNLPLVRYMQVQNPDLVDPLQGVDLAGGRVSPTLLAPDSPRPTRIRLTFVRETVFRPLYAPVRLCGQPHSEADQRVHHQSRRSGSRNSSDSSDGRYPAAGPELLRDQDNRERRHGPVSMQRW